MTTQALTTAAEVARGRAQAVRNAEELGRELRSAEEEVFRLHAALDAAHATNDLVKKRAESRLEAMVLSVKEEMDGGSKVRGRLRTPRAHKYETSLSG